MNLLDETTASSMDLPEQHVALGIRPDTRRVRAMFAGHVIADSDDVLVLRRHGLPTMRFFPRDDVETGYLGRTARTLADPDLGPATFYTWAMDGQIVEDAVCAFESPSPEAEALKDRLCLSESVFEIYELTPSDLAAAPHATHAHGGTA
jgi:uncharacterized protein (DUF427 family)